MGKHTQAEWELTVEGIVDEIKANGTLNEIDVTNEEKLCQIATSVTEDARYIDEVFELAHSNKNDQNSRYYDILWNTIDSYK